MSDEEQTPGPNKFPPQAFPMVRNADETGVSGTGVVAEGCVFSNGKCVVEWIGATPCTQVWPTFDCFKAVHIKPHPGNKTEIRWLHRKDDDA